MVNVMPPSVELDTTVAELYRRHGITGPFITSTMCAFARLDLHPEWTRETIFPEDEEPIPYGTDEGEKNQLRKMILGLKPVRRAFAVGDMDVIILLGPGVEKGNVDRVFKQLVPEQRPRPKFVDLKEGGVRQHLLRLSQGKKLIYWRSQGWQLDHDCLIPPSVSYEMNSKLFLLTSGIHTPASEVVDLPEDIEKTRDFMLATRKLPFVVKLFWAACGFGTHLVTTEDRRKVMLKAMVDYRKRGGTQVLLSEYINAKRSDLSAHFIIGAPDDNENRDNPLIAGVAMQSLTTDGRWTGGSIDYGAQGDLCRLLQATIRDTTRRFPESFVGWCGVDIIIDEQDKQWVVDLNARYTGSVALCLLSNHFHKRQGLQFAEAGSFKYTGDCDSVYQILSRHIGRGKVIVNATVSLDEGLNMVDLVWGGYSREDLAATADAIRRALA